MVKINTVNEREKFTIYFIGHNEWEVMEHIVPHNIQMLCENTKENFDIILLIDGAESINASTALHYAKIWGIDEVRLRNRSRHCKGGDPSNNAHMNLFTFKTPYVLSVESDVAIFKQDDHFDILKFFHNTFLRHPLLSLIARVDDFSCWKSPLKIVGEQFEHNLLNVNRVASHFLVYNVLPFTNHLWNSLQSVTFHDDTTSWFNYEDYLSQVFSCPYGPGIGFSQNSAFKVFHCDQKVHAGSPYYKRNNQLRLKEFLNYKNSVDWKRDKIQNE